MPFISYERRVAIQSHGIGSLLEIQPGDRCYAEYHSMVERWKVSPRWTTVHEIYADVLMGRASLNDTAALQLAWQVFFNLHVIPYELQKRQENGDI
jgi:hypothetical protein